MQVFVIRKTINSGMCYMNKGADIGLINLEEAFGKISQLFEREDLK